MATFITDRTQADVDTSLALFNKVKSTAWASLTSAEQNAYLSTNTLYEDRGRFSMASAERISSYMRELTSQLLEEVPAPIPTTIDGRSVGIWGSRNFKADPDYPSGTVKTLAVPSATNITNMVSNGDFASGTTGWTIENFTSVVTSPKIRLTSTVATPTAARISSTMTFTSGHKYYIRLTFQKISGSLTKVVQTTQNGTIAQNDTVVSDTSVKNVSFISTATITGSTLLRMCYPTTGLAIGDVIDFWSPVVLDLTALYGAGNEPTAVWMDAFLAANFTSSWFGGTTTFPDVNTTTDVAYILNHGLTVGQWYRVLYTTSSTTLGGLTSGDYYDIYVVDAQSVAFRYGGVGTDVTSKPASGTYTLNFITAPYFAVSRDDFQYWVDILTAKYGANPTGWTPINSPYLNFETLNILEQKTEAILSGSIATITESSGTYMTNDEMLIFDDYLGL